MKRSTKFLIIILLPVILLLPLIIDTIKMNWCSQHPKERYVLFYMPEYELYVKVVENLSYRKMYCAFSKDLETIKDSPFQDVDIDYVTYSLHFPHDYLCSNARIFWTKGCLDTLITYYTNNNSHFFPMVDYNQIPISDQYYYYGLRHDSYSFSGLLIGNEGRKIAVGIYPADSIVVESGKHYNIYKLKDPYAKVEGSMDQ